MKTFLKNKITGKLREIEKNRDYQKHKNEALFIEKINS